MCSSTLSIIKISQTLFLKIFNYIKTMKGVSLYSFDNSIILFSDASEPIYLYFFFVQ